jgi:hypothetical protein
MVVLKVNAQELEHYEKTLTESGIRYATFEEPDFGNIKTAIAIQPSVSTTLFSHLKLAG